MSIDARVHGALKVWGRGSECEGRKGIELAVQHVHADVAIKHAGSQMKNGRRHAAQPAHSIDGPVCKQ